MHWYGGSITEAVSLSKQRNAIFVVFVEGENDLSAEMAATLDDSAVVKRLSDQDNFLAVKLKSGSTNYTHFAQIYQFVPVPSLFFIGRNGTPLEVVCAGVHANNLATRIDRILEEHQKEKCPSIQPSTSSQNIKEQTASLLQAEATSNPPATSPSPAPPTPLTAPPVAPLSAPPSAPPSAPSAVPSIAPSTIAAPVPVDVEPETSSGPAAKIQKTEHHEVTRSGKEYDVVCDGDICVRRPRAKPDEPGPSQSTSTPVAQDEKEVTASENVANIDEKVEHAKEVIDAIRKEKVEKEKELEKQKEMERRAAGQGVAELKRWQADQELKQIQEERKREKMENNLARQRILEQIAQDRVERRAREAPPPPPAPAPAPAPAPPLAPQPSHPSHQAPVTSGDGGSRARIQFKLPDGSSHTAHFAAEGTLADLQRYVADNLQLSQSSFSLWTAFPRRELTDRGATLRRLELAPSAALLVLPRRAAAAVAAPSPLAALLTFFTQFFTAFILEPSQQLFTWLRVRLFPPPPSSGEPSPSTPRTATTSTAIRRRGNIHRLPGDRAGDDDNNTWNGNSTQQM